MAGSSKLLSTWLGAAEYTALDEYRCAAGRAVHHTSVRKDSASEHEQGRRPENELTAKRVAQQRRSIYRTRLLAAGAF